MQPWNHHPHWFVYHCQAVCRCGCFRRRPLSPHCLFCHVCCDYRAVRYPRPVWCIRGPNKKGMTARVERGGLVTGGRRRPVFSPLWVLKLCIGAFCRPPPPAWKHLLTETQGYSSVSEMQIRNDFRGPRPKPALLHTGWDEVSTSGGGGRWFNGWRSHEGQLRERGWRWGTERRAGARIICRLK